jgi:predicted metal-dependent hydrolase
VKESRSGGEGRPHVIAFGKQFIPFTIVFSARRGLKIAVRPDRTVEVSAPAGKSVEQILGRVRSRASWIARQREYFERFSPIQPPRRYISGETHRYLGRQFRLNIVQDGEESVKLLGKYLVVRAARPKDSARVRALVEGWYNVHCRKVIAGRLEQCYAQVRKSGISKPIVRFQKMEKRWGSCSRKGKIVLNSELAKASVPCIDYVLFHELCHLRYPHHGKEFYRLLARYVPEWRKWKERLEMATL